MSKGLLAGKIGSLRKSKGFSQEELAEYASINLRTLQRIENGKTEPRGQTLRLIAKALETPVEDFLDFTKEEDTGFLQLMNLSALSFWVIPLGNIFIPLALWVMKRDKVKGVNELGRRIINFQITWTFVTFGMVCTWMAGVFVNSNLPGFLSPDSGYCYHHRVLCVEFNHHPDRDFSGSAGCRKRVFARFSPFCASVRSVPNFRKNQSYYGVI